MTNEEFQKIVLEQLAGIKTDIAKLDQKIDSVKTELKQDVESVVTEQQKDVMTMLEIVTRKVGPIERIEAKLDVVNDRIFEQETDIRILKKAK